jgi:hypothetical protein
VPSIKYSDNKQALHAMLDIEEFYALSVRHIGVHNHAADAKYDFATTLKA